jgi:hypothetical protein
MKQRSSGILVALGALFIATLALAQPGALPAERFASTALNWKAVRGGAQQASIVGDPTKEGLYSYQLRVPAGNKAPPHYHTGDRVAVVISGTFYVGYGDRWDESAMMRLPAGSAWTEPDRQPHYAWAKDGDVVLHVVGIGPEQTTQIPQSP